MKFLQILPKAAIALSLAALAACQQQSATDSDASAAPDAKPDMSVSNGVLVLPAVKGNPGVAYFALTNGSDQPTTLAAVHVEGAAKTEMHETKGGKMEPMSWAQVEPGQTMRFERGGKHVMLFDLAETVTPGATAEMTLTFSGGDKLSTPLRVEAAGGGEGGH